MLKQPVGFVKLTNVALVRYKVKGRRFEVACYPNKAVDWRNGQEQSLAEVLQSDEVFSNAEQGELARATDLRLCFGDVDKEQVIRLILDKGELQVSQRERDVLLENIHNEVVTIVAQRLVYAANKRAVPLEQVKAALRGIGFQPNLNRPARKQANEKLRQLEEQYNVERAAFLVRVVGPPALAEELRQKAPFDVLQSGAEETLCIVSTRRFPQLEAAARAHDCVVQVVDEAYCNKQPRSFGEDEVFLQRRDAPPAASPPKADAPPDAPATRSEGLSCTTCGGVKFEERSDYRQHIQSEWHKHNLQAKVRGEPPVASDKFEELRLMLEMMAAAQQKNQKQKK